MLEVSLAAKFIDILTSAHLDFDEGCGSINGLRHDDSRTFDASADQDVGGRAGRGAKSCVQHVEFSGRLGALDVHLRA